MQIVCEVVGMKPVPDFYNVTGLFFGLVNRVKRLPVIWLGEAVFNCHRETSAGLGRLIEVINKIKT
jgi:hypothetical protein